MKKLLLIITLLLLIACTSIQEVKKDSKEYHSKGFVKIRNDKQYLTIGTKNIEKPVLLYLHGGPGLALTPITFEYFKNLEKDFIVVFWDQRGAGKSFDGMIASKYQTIDSFVEDTKEVTEYLKKKFNKEKIYLVGNSWGSLLGMKTINKYPELYYSFVGTGQVVDMKEDLKVSYDLMLKKSIDSGDKTLEKELRLIDRNELEIAVFGGNIATRKYASILSDEEKKERLVRNKDRLANQIGNENIEKEYRKKKWKTFLKKRIAYNSYIVNLKSNFLYTKLRKEMININLKKEIPSVNIPVYFAGGKSDLRAPYTLLEEYYYFLEAPKKDLIWFENSGHGAEFQEPEKFAELMKRVQKETLDN